MKTLRTLPDGGVLFVCYKLLCMEINLVSSCCVGAYLMRDYYNCQYMNPFVWTSIDSRSMRNLIMDWDDLNWFNIDVKVNNYDFAERTEPIIIIDDKVRLEYPHIKMMYNYQKPRKVGNNVEVTDVWSYAAETYFRHVKRMLLSKLPPVFVWGGGWPNQMPSRVDADYIGNNYSGKYKVIYAINVSIKEYNSAYARWVWGSGLLK